MLCEKQSFLHDCYMSSPSRASYLLGPNILVFSLFVDVRGVCSYRARDKVLRSYYNVLEGKHVPVPC
jgi:hypothetical protein